jgi:hypothetical protein
MSLRDTRWGCPMTAGFQSPLDEKRGSRQSVSVANRDRAALPRCWFGKLQSGPRPGDLLLRVSDRTRNYAAIANS